MMTDVFTPEGIEPTRLICMIEHTEDAFTEGRRNNDMVDWFIARRLIDLEEGTEYSTLTQMENEYTTAFRFFLNHEADECQRRAMDTWRDSWPHKLGRLVGHYGRITDPTQLHRLWLPMEYDDLVPDNQQAIPGI